MAANVDGGSSLSIPQAGGVKVTPTNWGGIERQSMKTLDAMNKLTEGMIQPYVNQMETKQFYEGQAKVAQGQALKDIEANDPWYMNIVGPSATVRGAQAMTATTALQQHETDFMQAMPDLRKQSPEEVRNYLVSKASNIKSTGDPLVDTTVQAKMAEQWGPMLKTHMREHLAFQQEDMMQKYTTSNVAVGASMKAARDATTTGISPEDRQRSFESAVESARPLPGQSEDSWNHSIADTLRASLDAGQFDHYEAIKQSDLYQKINPKVREHLEQTYHSYVMKDAQKNPAITNLTTNSAGFEFNLQHGMTNVTTEAELDNYIDNYNTQYTQKNGATEPYYDNKSRAGLHKSWLAGKLQRETSLAVIADKNAEKQAKYNESFNLGRSYFTSGNSDVPPGTDETGMRDGQNDLFDNEVSKGDPQQTARYFQRAAQVSGNDKLRSSKLVTMMQSGIDGILTGGGAVTSEQKRAYGYAAMMLKEGQDQGMSALTNYLGSAEKALKLTAFINSGVSPDDEKGMADQRRRVQEGGAPTASTQEKEAVMGIVAKSDPGWFKRIVPFVGGPGQLSPFEVNPEAKKFLGEVVAGRAAQYARAYKVPLEQATRAVFEETLQNADLVSGAVIINKNNVRGDVSLSSAVSRLAGGKVSQANSNYQEAVRNVIREKLTNQVKAAGGDMSHFDPDDYITSDGVQMGQGSLNLHLTPKNPGQYGLYNLSLHPQEVWAAVKKVDSERSTRAKAATGEEKTKQQRRERGDYGSTFADGTPSTIGTD